MAADWPFNVVLKPEEAWNIDTKIDDGKPATGRLVMLGAFASCTDTASSSNMGASYLLSNTAAACSLIFRQAF